MIALLKYVNFTKYLKINLKPAFPKHLTILVLQHSLKSQKYRKITQFLFGNTIVM
jgi:hypothetical protein